jgi:predicted pyridoxine 5'-phosphate oxidase superfamily flavin-nucleotide-binding protein
VTIRHLDRLLSPSSVAVFGASNRTGSVDTTVWRNVRAGGFAGPVYPVNPKHSTLDGTAGIRHGSAGNRTARHLSAPDLDLVPEIGP